jgi:hypothetical protein
MFASDATISAGTLPATGCAAIGPAAVIA